MYLVFGKRCSDLMVGISGLVLLSPLILVIVVLILIFDPGPVVFKQERIGVGGERFLFYKFRSMPEKTESVPSGQLGKFKRTWIGKFIRRTNLDELPQLFNMIRGDMSLVGPRPPIPSQIELIDYRRKNGALIHQHSSRINTQKPFRQCLCANYVDVSGFRKKMR